MQKSFYEFILSYRGGGRGDPKARFAETAFLDHSFPRSSTSFEELSSYIETIADADMTTTTFDELWDIYKGKYA